MCACIVVAIYTCMYNVAVVCGYSFMQLRLTCCDPRYCSMPGFPVLHRLTQIHIHWVMMLSNHITHCCPLLLLPSICLNISVFSNKSAFHMRWPKYWNCSISSSNEYSGLISFRIDNLIPLQSKGLSGVFSITTVQRHQFFGVQLILWSYYHIHTDYWKIWQDGPLSAK